MEKENKKMKKIMPIIIIAILVVAIIIIPVFLGGKKSNNTTEPIDPAKQAEQTVRDYITAFNAYDAEKLVDAMDMKGSIAWGYLYAETNLTENDYNTFIKDYEAVTSENEEQGKDTMKMIYGQSFEEIKNQYSEYSINVNKVEDVKKIGEKLYGVTVQRTVKAKPIDETKDELNETDTMIFIVYNNKVIYSGI